MRVLRTMLISTCWWMSGSVFMLRKATAIRGEMTKLHSTNHSRRRTVRPGLPKENRYPIALCWTQALGFDRKLIWNPNPEPWKSAKEGRAWPSRQSEVQALSNIWRRQRGWGSRVQECHHSIAIGSTDRSKRSSMCHFRIIRQTRPMDVVVSMWCEARDIS